MVYSQLLAFTLRWLIAHKTDFMLVMNDVYWVCLCTDYASTFVSTLEVCDAGVCIHGGMYWLVH